MLLLILLLLLYLPPPLLLPQGSWNLRDVRFPAGSQIRSWAFTTLVDPQYLTNEGETGTMTFLRDLVQMCNKTGVRCETPVLGPYDPRDSLEQRIRRAAEAAKASTGVE